MTHHVQEQEVSFDKNLFLKSNVRMGNVIV